MDAVSGVIGVIGMADVAIRAGRELYAFVSTAKNASKEMKKLGDSLRHLEFFVKATKDHFQSLHCNQFSISTYEQLVTDAATSLEAIRQEILAIATPFFTVNSHDKPIRTWQKIKWALNDKRVSQLVQSLESHKMTLAIALIVGERYESLHLHRSVQPTLQETGNKLISDLHNNSLEEIIGGVKAITPPRQSRIQGPRKNSNAETKQSNGIKVNVTKSQKHLRRELLRKEEKLAKNVKGLHTDIKCLMNMLQQAFPTEPSPEYDIQFFGPSLEATLLPLLLLQPRLASVASLLLGNENQHLTYEEFDLFKSDVDFLIHSAKRVGNATTNKRYGKLSPNFSQAFPPVRDTILASCEYKKLDMRKSTYTSVSTKFRQERKDTRSIWYSECTAGVIEIRKTDFFAVPISSSAQNKAVEFELRFEPSPGLESIGLIATFQHIFTNPPTISRQLCAFSIIPDSDFYTMYDLIKTEPVSEIDYAIRTGQISPYALDQLKRCVIHYAAARAGRLDVLEYLFNQGLGPSLVAGGSHALRGLCELWRIQAVDFGFVYPDRDDIYRWLLDHGCDVDNPGMNDELSVLYTVSTWRNWSPNRAIHLFRRWIHLLIKEGYDLETRNDAGETALLVNASLHGGYSVEAVSYLIRSGANPNAINSRGENALICVLCSITTWSETYRDVIERKLSILIAAGCDINKPDSFGYTPSDHAIKQLCWYEWCDALADNGISIRDVLLRDETERARLDGPVLHQNSSSVDSAANLPTRKTEKLTVLSPRATYWIDRYARWRKVCSVAIIFLKHSLENFTGADEDYHILINFLNHDGRGGQPYMYKLYEFSPLYEVCHERISTLAQHQEHLFNFLCAYDRTLPPPYITETALGHRRRDRFDDMIIIINRLKIRGRQRTFRSS